MKIMIGLIAAGFITCSSIGVAQECSRDVALVAAPDEISSARQQTTPDVVLVDEQPGLKKSVGPVYPPEALAKGLEGKVWLKILVDTTGHPSDVQVLKSENEIFNANAMAAARQFIFTPAMKDKKPVPVWITLPFKFKLADKEAGAQSRSGTPQGSQQAEEFLQKVEMIFAGGQSARALIHPEAYLIDGARFVSLNEALFGKEKGKCFAGEAKRQRSFMKMTIADDGTSAVLVLRTENAKKGDPRWHTVAWSRDKGGEWKVTNWHTSR
jgi:TonB family protein